MGRKKIQIQTIHDERLRNITFNKRKAGLLKKAAELSMLCNIKVCLAFTDVYGNLINFFSPDSSVIQDFKTVQPYKRIYTFTNDDYPHFFGKNKNRGGEEGCGDEQMNFDQSANEFTSNDNDIEMDKEEQELKEAKIVPPNQSHIKSKAPIGLQIKIPEKNLHLQNQMDTIKMMNQQQQNNQITKQAFNTKQEQQDSVPGDISLQQLPQQNTSNESKNYQKSYALDNYNSEKNNNPQLFGKKQEFEYNLKSMESGAGLSSVAQQLYSDNLNNTSMRNFGFDQSQGHNNSAKNNNNNNMNLPLDKDVMIFHIYQQMQQMQQDIKNQQLSSLEKEREKDLMLMKLRQQIEEKEIQKSKSNENLKLQQQQYSHEKQDNKTDLHNDNQTLEKHMFNSNNDQQNISDVHLQQQNISSQQHHFNLQRQNALYMNLPPQSQGLGILQQPPSSNQLFQINSNGAGGISGYNFLNSLGDNQGRTAFYTLQNDIMMPPNSNPNNNNNQSSNHPFHVLNQIGNNNQQGHDIFSNLNYGQQQMGGGMQQQHQQQQLQLLHQQQQNLQKQQSPPHSNNRSTSSKTNHNNEKKKQKLIPQQ